MNLIAQQEAASTGVEVRGGAFQSDDENLLDVIEMSDYAEVHRIPGHCYFGMFSWEILRVGHRVSELLEPLKSISSIHVAQLRDGRWLLWRSKTEKKPASFEVKSLKPTVL